MKIIRSVWFLLAFLVLTAQSAFAREITITLESGNGSIHTGNRTNRIDTVATYLLNKGWLRELQAGDTIKAFFPNGWLAKYQITFRSHDGMTVTVDEIEEPTPFTVTSNSGVGEGASWGCSGGVTVTPVGYWQGWSVTVSGLPSGSTNWDWVLSGFNYFTQQNCN